MVRQIESGGHPAKGVARVQRALIAARMPLLIASRFNFAVLLTARHNGNDPFTFISGTTYFRADDSALGFPLLNKTSDLVNCVVMALRHAIDGRTLDYSSIDSLA